MPPRMKPILSCALVAFIASPASAQSLEFSSIDAQTDPTTSSEVSCKSTQVYWDCKLNRSAFGGIPINWSIVSVRPEDGKIRFVSFTFDRIFFDSAVRLFSEKYGKPGRVLEKEMTNKTGGPYLLQSYQWAEFDSGGSVSLTRSEHEGSVDIKFSLPKIETAEREVDF